MISREDALALIREHVKNENSIKHMLATESIMKELALHFNQDEVLWSRAGLLHDLDMEKTNYLEHPETHGLTTIELLKDEDVPQELLDIILAHNEMTGTERITLAQKCIYAADPMTGLIVASALVTPSKKLNDLKSESILKRSHELRFAAGVKRESINSITETGLSLEELITLSLKAMKSISNDLNL